MHCRNDNFGYKTKCAICGKRLKATDIHHHFCNRCWKTNTYILLWELENNHIFTDDEKMWILVKSSQLIKNEARQCKRKIQLKGGRR